MSVKQVLLQQIDNFMNELCTIFPENGEIQLFGQKYNLIRNANSKMVIEYFVQFVYPHKTEIMNCNENFFLDGGGQEELKDNSGLKFRDNIRNLWIKEMSDENKEIIWKYFKIFIILSEKYILETLNNEK
jgi:hypothetical protein